MANLNFKNTNALSNGIRYIAHRLHKTVRDARESLNEERAEILTLVESTDHPEIKMEEYLEVLPREDLLEKVDDITEKALRLTKDVTEADSTRIKALLTSFTNQFNAALMQVLGEVMTFKAESDNLKGTMAIAKKIDEYRVELDQALYGLAGMGDFREVIVENNDSRTAKLNELGTAWGQISNWKILNPRGDYNVSTVAGWTREAIKRLTTQKDTIVESLREQTGEGEKEDLNVAVQKEVERTLNPIVDMVIEEVGEVLKSSVYEQLVTNDASSELAAHAPEMTRRYQDKVIEDAMQSDKVEELMRECVNELSGEKR